MDLSFTRRARLAGRHEAPAPVDYGMLVAALGAAQARTPTAEAASRLRGRRPDGDTGLQGLVALLLGEPGWQAAASLRQGSFDPALAARSIAAEA